MPPLGCQPYRLSITATSLKNARNLGLLASEYSWFKNSLQIQPKPVFFLMTPSFSQHLSKFSQHKQNSLYISNPTAFLIIDAAHFGCCRMKSLISAMETFGLQWSFFKSSIQLKNDSPMFKRILKEKVYCISEFLAGRAIRNT